mmetsp:Transcript_12168/g.10788  ORF Transcript_12168/g.10788 Transcript_12168/m.10788 type:complete len:145 (-) Transcript_12168:234-668(-)
MTHQLLYIPNIIGYIRAIFMILSWNEAFTNPNYFILYYFISYTLDMADGFAARTFNQCTKFGAVLDMVLDRITTASLFAILANVYQDQAIYFLLFLGLDLGSHWLQVVTTYAKGNDSHKGDDDSESAVVKIYYKSKIMLASVCA